MGVLSSRNVVIAHDYLTQTGGAERVALEIAQSLNARQIVTSVYAREGTYSGFEEFNVLESYLARVQPFRRDPRLALPFLARAWSSMSPDAADVVVCSSSGWSHGVPVQPGVAKVVYCHNPPRWLYQREDYLIDQPMPIRAALAALHPSLLRWDQRAAKSADLYIANSTSVAARIEESYGIEARIIYPPVSIDAGVPQEPIDQLLGKEYFLTVGRTRGYKGTKTLIEAFRKMPNHALAIVGMDAFEDCPPNVIPLGRLSESQLGWAYSHGRALVSISREDFGLTPVEANAFGTPALVLRAGGFIDSTAESISGSFIEFPTIDSIIEAVDTFRYDWDKSVLIEHASRFGAARFLREMSAAMDSVL